MPLHTGGDDVFTYEEMMMRRSLHTRGDDAFTYRRR